MRSVGNSVSGIKRTVIHPHSSGLGSSRISPRWRKTSITTRQRDVMVQRGSPPKPHPRFIEPMECLAVEHLPDVGGWLYEVKLDGYRVVAVKDGKDVGLYSRYGNVLTADFPAVAFALRQLPARRLVVDGEIVALDAKGSPSFQRLQNRKRNDTNIVLYVFDLLHLEGKDLLSLPLQDRRNKLEELSSSFDEPLRLAPVLNASLDA